MKKTFTLILAGAALLMSSMAVALAPSQPQTAEYLPAEPSSLSESDYIPQPALTLKLSADGKSIDFTVTMPTQCTSQWPAVDLVEGDIKWVRIQRYTDNNTEDLVDVWIMEHGEDGVITPGKEYKGTDPNPVEPGHIYYYKTDWNPKSSWAWVTTPSVDTNIYPEAVQNVSVTSDKGSLPVSIEFDAPSKDINGNPITSIDRIEIIRRDNNSYQSEVIKTYENPTPGEHLTYIDETAVLDGSYAYSFKTYTPYGNTSSSMQYSYQLFVGQDAPGYIDASTIKAVCSDDFSSAIITWEPPTTGLKGGYPGTEFTYSFYIQQDPLYTNASKDLVASDITTNSYTLQFDKPLTAPESFTFYVIAKNSIGSGNTYSVPVCNYILGPSLSVPFTETFAVDNNTVVPKAPWTTGASSSYLTPSLTSSASAYAGGVDYYIYGSDNQEGEYGRFDGFVTFQYSSSDGPNTQWLTSSPIKGNGEEDILFPVVSFYTYEIPCTEDNMWDHTISVQAIVSDAVVAEQTVSPVTIKGENVTAGWKRHAVCLDAPELANDYQLNFLYSSGAHGQKLAIDKIDVRYYSVASELHFSGLTRNPDDMTVTLVWQAPHNGITAKKSEAETVEEDSEWLPVVGYKIVADGETVATVGADVTEYSINLDYTSHELAIVTLYDGGLELPAADSIELEASPNTYPAVKDFAGSEPVLGEGNEGFVVTLSWSNPTYFENPEEDTLERATGFQLVINSENTGDVIPVVEGQKEYTAKLTLPYDTNNTVAVKALYFDGLRESELSSVLNYNVSGITDITLSETTDGVFFNLQGMRIERPQIGSVLIRIADGKASKVRVIR